MFACNSIVVVEGACVRDCSSLGLCTVGTVSSKCRGGRSNELTGEGKEEEKVDEKGQKE
jgi:hypothetical protein